MLRPMLVDLRSDTVTRPSPAMRRAMADADVGDDVYGEDPTAQRLEQLTAELLGQEAAVFVPSGTMANQIALQLHCKRGDAVIVGEGTHCMAFESGAGAAFAGVQFSTAGQGGLFDVEELEQASLPTGDLFPRARLCVIENTHNRAGRSSDRASSRTRPRGAPRRRSAVECRDCDWQLARFASRSRRLRECVLLEGTRCAGRLRAGWTPSAHP
jgi:hypothetical protein